jgi:hypothetical protein
MSSITVCRTTRLAAAACTLTLIGLIVACSSGSSAPAPTYALGGTVSRLSASGLVLSNNGQPLTVSSGATSFNFGSILTFGSAYAVSVQTQPAGETCTVAGGSGTARTANIANVVVACAEQAFSLGGTVSGLTTSGLVLANGDQTVAVDASAATFTFAASVAKGSSYAVTVKTQPVGLACAVSEGTGTMPSSNVSTVAVSCTDQPFSLGGSISGLTTSGLVLANGTDTLTVDAHATSFRMPAAVAYGGHYAVTVHSQPTGLTCTVSNGSGTMPASAVTNVAVVCADQSYLLGGSISGLTATGLVLANGSNTLTLDANATTFTLPTAVAYGSQYAVTVQTQPTGFTCTVSGGTGTMPAGPVTNVTVTCAILTYTVGGSISSLTTSGLVLASGTDTLDVAANAAMFTMPTGVASGATYDVTIQTQPAAQTCAVNNGSGTVVASDVTTVAVSCVNVVSYTTPGAYSLTVPDGMTSIQVVATGGGGGGNAADGSNRGGNGGIVTATLAVTAGDTLTLYVGGGGGGVGGSYSGSGGGGSSNINAGTANQIIAGGGGGGGPGVGQPAAGGDGGGSGSGGGSSGANGSGGSGGGGAGGTGGVGGAGGTGGMGPDGAVGGNGNGGAGGTGGNGGAGGSGTGNGAGGAGGNGAAGGGGGGGYGGGGGASSGPGGDGGGGGGGSIGPAGVTFTVSTNGGAAGANGGDGSIVITLNP